MPAAGHQRNVKDPYSFYRIGLIKIQNPSMITITTLLWYTV